MLTRHHRFFVLIGCLISLCGRQVRAQTVVEDERRSFAPLSAHSITRVTLEQQAATRATLPCQNVVYRNGMGAGAVYYIPFGGDGVSMTTDCTPPPGNANRFLCAAQVQTFGSLLYGGPYVYNLTVRVWSDCPDAPGATLIAQGTFAGLPNDQVERISTVTIDPPYLDDDGTVWVEVASTNPDAAWLIGTTDPEAIGTTSGCLSFVDHNGTCNDDSNCAQHFPYVFPVSLYGAPGPVGSCCSLAGGTCTDGVTLGDCSEFTTQSWSASPCASRSDCVACAGPACPIGSSLENEPDCFSNYNDTTNCGCANLSTGADASTYTPISCGQSGCGRTGTYTYVNGANLEYRRDDDHYLLTLTQDTRVTWTVSGEFPSEAIVSFTVMQTNGTGSLHCPTQIYTGPGDTPDATAGPCQNAVASVCLPGSSGLGYPLRYLLRARPSVSKLGANNVCGVPYTFNLSCQPCSLPTGACCTAAGCVQVSRLACLIATGSDTHSYYGDGTSCPQASCTGAPPNDLCQNAIVLTCTSCVIPYDTTFANGEGQVLGQGGVIAKDVWFDYNAPTAANAYGCTLGRITVSTLYNCYNTKLTLIRYTNCALNASQRCIGTNMNHFGTFLPIELEAGPPIVDVGPWTYGRGTTVQAPATCYKVRVGGLTDGDFGPGTLRIDYVCQTPSTAGWDTSAGRCCFWNSASHTGNCMIAPRNTAGGNTCCAALGGYLNSTTDYFEGSTSHPISGPNLTLAETQAVGCATWPCPAEGEACFNAWDLNSLMGGPFGVATRRTRNRIYFKYTVPANTVVGSGITLDACGTDGDPDHPASVYFDSAMAVYRGFNFNTGECHQLDTSSGGPGTQVCTNTGFNNAEIIRVDDCSPLDVHSAGAQGSASCFSVSEVDPCVCLNVVAANPGTGQVSPGQTIWIGMGIKNLLTGSPRPFTDPVRSDFCATVTPMFSIRVANPSSCFSCSLSCPGGATSEGENLGTCLNYVDHVDAGCNAMSTADIRFLPVACGQTYCGSSATYRKNISCGANSTCTGQDQCVSGTCQGPEDNMKDYDFYRIQVTSPTRLTWTVNATFPVAIQMLESTNDQCTSAVPVAAAVNFDSCTSTVASADICPGYVYLSIAPAVDSGVGCGKLYYATLTCSAPPAANCCPGDVNNDGRVNGDDIREWLNQLAAPVGQPDSSLSPFSGCFSLRTCSADFTGDYTVDLADLPGFVSALLSSSTCSATACESAPACHTVSSDDSALVSDVGTGLGAPSRAADDFMVTQGTSLTKICWWGSYFNFTQIGGCAVPAGDSADNFRITLYSDASGLPGPVLVGPVAPVNLVKTDTGVDQAYLSRAIRRFKYEADLPAPQAVSPDGCYWLEIVNHATGSCVWVWETSALNGNGVCAQKANGSAGASNWQAFDLVANDLAFCLSGLRIAPSDCGLPPGRCCVYPMGSAFGTCSIQTRGVCESILGGHWQLGSDCSTACPVVQTSGGCPGSPHQSVGPDVVVADITGPQNETANGNLAVIAFGADACNVGDQQVAWDACPANTHPEFGGNVYKWYTTNGATRFEQIAQSWLKDGFGADQARTCCQNCQPSGNFARLGIGCSDAYAPSQFASYALSPKYQMNAHTGFYPTGCTVHPSDQPSGQVEMSIDELTPTNGGTGAAVRIFAQFQYLTADDALAHNQNNNASSREMSLSGSGTNWTFAFPGWSSTQIEIPSIRLWKTIDSGVVETDIDTPEDDGFPGLVIMAAKATNLGNGFWHYEYAVNNLNSDRSIGSFSVPCPAGATVQNIGFHDVTYRGGDGEGNQNYDSVDWPGSFAGGAVSWATTPYASFHNANAIRWGTLYNFRFDANVTPAGAGGLVTLGMFKVVGTVTATTIIPAP